MPVTVTEDHATLRAWLGRCLDRDPVRGTLLGTIGETLGPGAWGAWAATDGAESLAVRCGPAYPLAVVGGWPAPDRQHLHALLAGLAQVHAISGPGDVVRELAAALPGRSSTMRQALYRLDELREPVGVSGHGTPATQADRQLAHARFAAFLGDVDEAPRRGDSTIDDALGLGHCWLWYAEDGRPVSMACRRVVFTGSARIGPVYTPPEHRGRGYGSAVTAAATRSILAEGAVPVLFADLANPTSNKIYQDLGYHRIDERIMVTFR
jgi:predicted GNAT family acetyltransferase